MLTVKCLCWQCPPPWFWHKERWKNQGSYPGNRATAHNRSYTQVIGFYTTCLKEDTWQISQRSVETGSICFKISVKKKKTHRVRDHTRLMIPHTAGRNQHQLGDRSVRAKACYGQRLLGSSFGAEFEIWYIDTHSTGGSFFAEYKCPRTHGPPTARNHGWFLILSWPCTLVVIQFMWYEVEKLQILDHEGNVFVICIFTVNPSKKSTSYLQGYLFIEVL